MIAILYPKEDYTAADVALKMQALASDHDNRTYIVPRHIRRNEVGIKKTLATATEAIFIIHDVESIDGSTLQDLKVLSDAGVHLNAIINYGVDTSSMGFYEKVKWHKYEDQNTNDLLKRASESLRQKKGTKKEMNEESGLILGLIGLGLLVLLFMGISDAKKV